MSKFLQDVKAFLSHSPTAYHAVAQIKKELLAKGFKELLEEDAWKLKKEGHYFCMREGSLIAFGMPKSNIKDALILASHTDSPAFKLKPNAEFIKEEMVMWGVEVYGAPLLNSWLNRDLGVAGKVLYTDKKGRIQDGLVNLENNPCTIPQVAIHLDREVNEKGVILNKQEHLAALASIQDKPDYLLKLLKEQLPMKELLAHDLFLYPLEKPAFLGHKSEMLASYRIDSLVSVFAIMTAFLEKRPASAHELQMMAFFDHEEIGSGTASGAESPFFSHILERITATREAYLHLIPRSFCVSVDLGHSVHPNYPDKHDPRHKPKLGQGVLIKTHAQKKYATDVRSVKRVLEVASAHKIPFQMISTRNDIPSGSTIGPIHAALTGIPTVDLGIGQLSMHSARELISTEDLISLKTLLGEILKN
jgi:aspartyl aminopeptidase